MTKSGRRLANACRFDVIAPLNQQLSASYPFSFPARFQFINSPIVDPVLEAGCL